MQDGNLELIVVLASIISANVFTVFGAFGFLHREMRRGFDRIDRRFEKFEGRLERLELKVDEGFHALRTDVDGLRTDVDGLRTDVDGLRTDVDALQLSAVRVEAHRGLEAPPPAARLGGGEPSAQTA